ncbi:MAG: hypothetical protein PUD24_07815 [Oscillospiraceae bacterium]|nr:hypothetical protein [Oscillospiraceae bacterium]
MKKLFGNNIKPCCDYCEFSAVSDGKMCCSKNKTFENEKCRSFKYDPLKRVPKTTPALGQFSPEDFAL